MTKTISIYIFLEDEPSVECITAGNSAEHNATTLKFILESTFTDEFKYYLDFVLPNGKILRTDYLPLDKNDENSVSFDVPASVTKYGTAECCLNAVKIDENGITTEVMKPKNVILYFNTLADADGALLSDYDFSVNTMLENIKNGVFKGEKGDKGDNGKDGSNYILTEKDKKEIAALINKSTYGLPYTRRVSGENTLTLTDSLAMPFNGFTVYGKTSVTGSYGGTAEPASSVKISGVSSVKIGINGAEQTVNTGGELFSAGDYADKADVISGIFTRKIGKYALTGNAQTVFAKSYTSGGVTLNRIYTPTPVGAKMVRGTGREEEVYKIELLLKQAHVTIEERKVVPAALKREEETGAPAAAMELPDGRIVTGKTSELLGASSALLLNALKELAGIDHDKHVISPEALKPIQALKTEYLGSKNPRLHSDETLIALSISAADNEDAKLALQQIPKLKGCQVHTSVLLSQVDILEFRKLGVELTCEPKSEHSKKLQK